MTDRSVVYKLRCEVTQFRAQMAQASASTQKLATDLTALDKNGATMRRGLTQVGTTGRNIGLVAAAGLGAAIVSAANFDQAMSNVQAATHETADNMNRLRDAALEAGAQTAFSASEAAAGIENLAKAGVSTSDILSGGLTGALDLAAAGNLDVATAAEAAATAMTQFGLSGEQVPHIADLLAAGAGKAQGEVTDLSMALNQSGLVAAQMGLSIEETTGTLSAFASAGLLGSDAGTSLKTALLRLANPSKESAQLMKELGINAYDANGNLVSMSDLAGQLGTAFEGQTQAQRDAALATIFGSDAIRAANVLYTQGSEGIDDWTNKVNDSGYAAETAATRLDNLKGDLEALKGSLETALIGTGDGSQGPLRSMVQNTTDLVNAFNDLPPAAKRVTSSFLGITAVTGGGLWLGSKVIGGIANTKQALSDLGWTAGQTKTSLASVGKGLEFGVILAGIYAVDKAFDALDNRELDGTSLNRNLEALADGRVVDNLDKIGSHIRNLNAEGLKATDTVFGWLPGETTMDEAAREVGKVDEALAAMVESGNADMAAAAFEQIQKQATDLGVSADDVRGSFHEYGTAVRNASGDTTSWIDRALRAGNASEDMGQAMDQARHSGDRLANRMEAQAKALQKSRKAAHETANGFVTLGDKLDNAKVSLGDWLKQLENQAAALRKFRVNAKEAAKKGLDEGLIASLEKAGPAGALRMKQLANATDEQIARANAAWRRGQREVQRYTDAIGGVPKSVTTDVIAHTETAMTKLYAVNRLKLDDKYVYVHTVRLGGDGTDFVSGGQRKHSAMGGYISGPGTATSDSIPAALSNGEYVMRASAVQQYGVGFFDRLNAQQFATGGYVGGGASSPIPSINFNGLRVTGTLNTPWGPAQVEGIAHAAAKSEINRHQNARRNAKGYGQ